MGLFSGFERLKSGLEKTRDALFKKIQTVLTSKGSIDEETLDRLEEVLLTSDVGYAAAEVLMDNIKRRVKEQKYETADQLVALLKDEVAQIFRESESTEPLRSFDALPAKPYVIMIVGVNGVGKTTTIGKLAHNFRSAGKSVLIGAADTFRAAANEQLEIWAQRAQVDIVQQKPGADPGSVVYDTVSSALARGSDVVLLDTAGRLHTRVNLMEELRKIRRVIEKRLPGAPHDVLLVLDAGMGQNSLQQVKQFSEAAGVTGLVITKLDGTAKGGIVLAVNTELSLPVRFVGVGERIDDLQPFDKTAFVEALFGGFSVPAQS